MLYFSIIHLRVTYRCSKEKVLAYKTDVAAEIMLAQKNRPDWVLNPDHVLLDEWYAYTQVLGEYPITHR